MSRRRFVRNTASLAAASGIASVVGAAEEKPAAPATAAPATPTKPAEPNPSAAPVTQPAKPKLAVIGCGGIANFHGRTLPKYVDIVAVADVDRAHAEAYNKDHAGGKAFVTQDYREVLKRPDVQLVLIATPDHWHSKVLIDALRAGKDVYCEKPLTLTIDEGRTVCRVARETGRVIQIGTQQRSEEQFLKAVQLAHLGRLGRIKSVVVAVGAQPQRGGDFATGTPPAELNYDMWLGQAPKVPYIKERTHFTFRWWYEYSGGMITDWGAHHVDIAQWAVAPDLPGPSVIEPVDATLPVPFQRGWPTVANSYNTATKYNVKCTFANGVEMYLCDKSPSVPADNGILIVGDGGTIFVNRQTLAGPAVDALKDDPIPEGLVRKVGDAPGPHERHFANFLECVKSRTTPASDIFSHVRNLTTCHLANIAVRVGRRIRWDATAQEIVGDPEADALQSRAQRKGYEVV